MAKHKKHRRNSQPSGPEADGDLPLPRRRTAVKSRRLPDGSGWELVHPRCARERGDDVDEVLAMLAAGETEVALDELRWLLEGCGDFIMAHRLLGELALGDHDYRLARGHFGYGFEIGWSALPHADASPVPYRVEANQALLECAKALALCLHELGKPRKALAVVKRLLHWDPSDPLGVRPWLSEWDSQSNP